MTARNVIALRPLRRWWRSPSPLCKAATGGRGPSLRPLLHIARAQRSIATFILLALSTGCATPKSVLSLDDLSRNIGNKVSLDGRYEVGAAGETLDTGAFTVALDRPDTIGGGGIPPNGSTIRATGVVARGAMALGVFIDDLSLRAMHAQKQSDTRNIPPTGFVLRSASLVPLAFPEPPPSPSPSQLAPQGTR